jgi:hypothetical protein
MPPKLKHKSRDEKLKERYLKESTQSVPLHDYIRNLKESLTPGSQILHSGTLPGVTHEMQGQFSETGQISMETALMV